MSIDELEPSLLGTRKYWDFVFKNERENFESFKDYGEIWFGEDLENKIINWLKNNISPQPDLKILDIGSGNGHFLCSLSSKGYSSCILVGIDYSDVAIQLSKTIANERGIKNISFETLDILNSEDYFNEKWDVIFDKGTFDSISLNDEIIRDTRACLLYPARIKKLIKKGGFFIITSCNWTKEELIFKFSSEDLIYHSSIDGPTFSFGGGYGSCFSTIIFTL